MEKTIVPKLSTALYLLFAGGFCNFPIGIAVLAPRGLVLNFHDDFDYEQVDIQHDYTQYWVGIVLVITAFLAIATVAAPRKRWLVVTAMFLFLVTILVSLFALVTEGNDWIKHQNAVRHKEFWESEDYECTSPSDTSCVCTKTNDVKWISTKVNCKTLERLDYLYGGLIGCILAGVFLALSSIVVVLKFIPIRPLTVTVVHPTAAKPASVIKEGLIANPNFTAQYVRDEPPPVRCVRREEPEQVRYVEKPTVVYVTRPRTVQKRALGARPQETKAVRGNHSRPSHILEQPRQRPLIVCQFSLVFGANRPTLR